jgi:hypothetical protein
MVKTGMWKNSVVIPITAGDDEDYEKYMSCGQCTHPGDVYGFVESLNKITEGWTAGGPKR